MTQPQLEPYFHQLQFPQPNSHKGQNGKILIIGGSELFHAASRWSLDIASKFVDMVFYCSVPSNNLLVSQAKQHFWNGMVIERNQLESYLGEADCILIGPGMDRSKETEQITNYLLEKYVAKKWVIDAGALQMLNPGLLNENCIITPHHQELHFLAERLKLSDQKASDFLVQQGVTILLKGEIDVIFSHDLKLEISGGNAGMTKGGTGDVLAGLVAALYATQTQLVATVVASHVCKQAGDQLFERTGYYFNASDLVDEIPTVLWDRVAKQSNSVSP